MISTKETSAPTQKQALSIIQRLREGVPPAEHVWLFSIGREELLHYFERVLDNIAKFDQQGIKFIQADYGHGKTHFLDMFAQLALARNFVVSYVSLDRDSAPFNKLERVVPLIMSKIMTPSTRQGGLTRLLEEWSQRVSGQDTNAILRELGESERLQLLSPDFKLKLAQYANAYNAPGGPEYERCLTIEKWFRGEEAKSKTFKSVPDHLAALVQFVRYLSYNGFLVMLDEAESITLLSRITNRDQANENLRQIIDNQNLEGFYFVFASTPTFLSGEDDRGAQTYPALWRRISDPLGAIGQKSLDKVIVELPELSVDQFSQLALQIRDIYQVAYSQRMPRVTNAHLERLAKYVRERTDKSIRTLVRSTVMLLDEARDNEELDVLSNYELIVERVLRDEERKRAM